MGSSAVNARCGPTPPPPMMGPHPHPHQAWAHEAMLVRHSLIAPSPLAEGVMPARGCFVLHTHTRAWGLRGVLPHASVHHCHATGLQSCASCLLTCPTACPSCVWGGLHASGAPCPMIPHHHHPSRHPSRRPGTRIPATPVAAWPSLLHTPRHLLPVCRHPTPVLPLPWYPTPLSRCLVHSLCTLRCSTTRAGRG